MYDLRIGHTTQNIGNRKRSTGAISDGHLHSISDLISSSSGKLEEGGELRTARVHKHNSKLLHTAVTSFSCECATASTGGQQPGGGSRTPVLACGPWQRPLPLHRRRSGLG